MNTFNTLSKLVSCSEKSKVVHILNGKQNHWKTARHTRCAFNANNTDVFYNSLPKGKRFCYHCANNMTLGELKALK